MKIDFSSAAQPQIRHQLTISGLTVVLGPNGAGKTSLLYALHGISTTPVYWNEKPAKDTKNQRGFVLQTPPMLIGNALQNLQAAGDLHGLKRSECQNRIEKLAKSLKLQSLLETQARNLSGGERARLAMAQAQIHAPRFLLLDEVTAHLDPNNLRECEEMMQNFAAKPDHAVIFVTHSIRQARRIAQNIIFVHQGDILYTGKAEEFWKSDNDLIQGFCAGELI